MRNAVALGLQQGMSVRAIARALGRSPSTISRESRRNAPAAPYNCKFAQQRYQRRRRYSRPQPKLRPCSNRSVDCCAGSGRPSRLPGTWLQCMAQIRASACHTKPSTPVSMPNPRGSYAANSSPACAWRAPLAALTRHGPPRRDCRSAEHPCAPATDQRASVSWSLGGRPDQGAGNLSAVGTLVERSSRLLMLASCPIPSRPAAHVLQAFSDKLLSIAQPLRRR
jgi:IS30 family transposase